jgi:hypothetical protein
MVAECFGLIYLFMYKFIRYFFKFKIWYIFFIFVNFNDTRMIFIYKQIKQAQVVALHKKNNALDKSNYRPVSILPVISKFFERAIHEQLTEYFNNHFYPFLSAFRSGYGCNTRLCRCLASYLVWYQL